MTTEETRPPIRDSLKRKAEQGDAAAQYEYAQCFDVETTKEAPTAIKWLRLAAENGHSDACMDLAFIYTEFEADEVEAIHWYRRGRELGAEHDISSFIFFGGLDKPPRNDWAERLRRSAFKSDGEAQYRLAKFYALGDVPWEFPLSIPKAYAWAAISSGYADELPSADEFVRPSEHWGDYGEPVRLARLLASILNDDEMEEARIAFKLITPDIRKRRFLGIL